MSYRRHLCWRALSAVAVLSSVACLATPSVAAPHTQTDQNSLQAAFDAAAREFGVPSDLLAAVAYNESRWEQHDGLPSTTGGYGVMHLTDVDSRPAEDARGKGTDQTAATMSTDPDLNTLDTAAQLLGVDPQTLKQDAAQNIRGGAALLRQYAIDTTGSVPANSADWYGAIAKYSGSDEEVVALGFADNVYATVQQGADRNTQDGKRVRINAKQLNPNRDTAKKLKLRKIQATLADCPNDLACHYVPAAYQINNPDDPSDYGNYDLADRGRDGLDIQYIVIHDTETPYGPTLNLFQTPTAYVSSHYVLRANDGDITQMVDNKNVAWHAGNWYVNIHAIGLEHEGYAIKGAAWYSEQLYRNSARQVQYLAQKYKVPVDRAHILGHDEVPGPTPANQSGMHWDPGPFWDWAHYMELINPRAKPNQTDDQIVTINPRFVNNVQQPLDCEAQPLQSPLPVQPQPVNYLYLRTGPDFNASLIKDNAIPNAFPLCANNWGNKAMTGEEFYLAERQGDWSAIYFGGQKAWFYNPGNRYTTPGSGTLITPKAGLASIPVYGRAYPEATAYPANITPQSIVPLQYTIPAGQVYVAKDLVQGDYYFAPTYTTDPAEHTVVEGNDEYYLIFFNHRVAYLKASDVEVVQK